MYFILCSNYLILAPKTACPGQDYSFSVIIKNARSDVFVQVQISGGRPNLISNISVTLQPGKYFMFYFILCTRC